jgi:tripartite-type tricarboxylate transporter receptor subunit TctC
VVINKPGASGVIGMQAAIQAAPDGHTLALVSTSDVNVVQAEIARGRKPPFTRDDLVFLGAYTRSPLQVVVPHNSAWRTLADMLNELKAQPGHYTYCSGGLYNVTHVAAELLLRATGTTAWLVPYKGAGDCIPAVVGGQIHFTTQFLSSTISLIQNNRLRALAVMGSERIRPDVPTTKELGIDVQVYQMLGLAAPRETPPAIVDRLKQIIRQVAEDPAFIRGVEATGDAVRYTSADDFTRYWDSDSARIAGVLKAIVKQNSR